MRKKLLIIFPIFIVIIVVGVVYFFGFNKAKPEEEVLVSVLQEELEVTRVKFGGDTAIITYNQPMELEDQEELFGTWAYILGTASQEVPEAKTIVVNCVFEDKQEVRITADRQIVEDFLDENITTLEFLQLITAEPIGKGPEI